MTSHNYEFLLSQKLKSLKETAQTNLFLAHVVYRREKPRRNTPALETDTSSR